MSDRSETNDWSREIKTERQTGREGEMKGVKEREKGRQKETERDVGSRGVERKGKSFSQEKVREY